MFTFPKPRMRLRELMAMGFSERELEAAYRANGQRFAHKLNPSKKNSPIVFDTDGLGKYFEKLAAAEDAAMRKRI